jgi:6-phosphogluconate dehydrogenase
MNKSSSDFGLIGLAVMGQNLALNVESRGFDVAVYNRSPQATEAFVAEHPGKRLRGAPTLEAFVALLKRPRTVMLMVKAGPAVDAVIEQLLPLLESGDIVIDGGNSHYSDTERRSAALAARGRRFGARKGPAIMPGGPVSTWKVLQPIFESIAARVDGQPCVMHIGEGGAGHYVKMVHNGIEYGDMQLICEAYAMFQAAGMNCDEMADVFDGWNEGELQSYLIQITGKILRQRDAQSGQPVVDLILDKAGQKGTGQWTLMNAADNAVVVSTINAAVEARVLSSMKAARVAASRVLAGPAAPIAGDRAKLVAQVRDALYASKIVSYTQGFDLMRTMGARQGWALDLGGIASIWRGGCIIRARFLNRITEAYRADPALANLMLAPFFRDALNAAQSAWRDVVANAVRHGIPVPAMSASLAYYDAYRSARLPANLLQAQRDFFGAHTYERVDRPPGQAFHTDWPEVID